MLYIIIMSRQYYGSNTNRQDGPSGMNQQAPYGYGYGYGDGDESEDEDESEEEMDVEEVVESPTKFHGVKLDASTKDSFIELMNTFEDVYGLPTETELTKYNKHYEQLFTYYNDPERQKYYKDSNKAAKLVLKMNIERKSMEMEGGSRKQKKQKKQRKSKKGGRKSKKSKKSRSTKRRRY